ncbi:putative polysaccharide biosynthesis protein [Aquisalibacillus elongatus]|uniref:O-antigen/teichoic acid export membrane protein n=1 Tax=Aquisalibacillus elongatus TaxID=485577 RepID=A0A3N5BCY7_9BACI|nr:polysaccharide biosynthesis protein [Aquisalibacillus elongatus]RPF55297.1 O-antigen/teichoic acid export membrane protein [Aquisalibacillus elongatus]
MSNSVLRGTMLLTGANYTSKILGMLYVIPFNMLVGESGGALYAYAYNPYQIFLTVSSLGIPMAMAKFVAKYDTLEDHATKQAMFRSGMMVMVLMGLIGFLIMFFSAEWLAQIFITNDDLTNSVSDVTFVIQMVSFALLVVSPMSLLRGYFQGHQSMGPSAISIVVEQIVRIVFLLAGAFIVINVLNGTVRLAVGVAAFAAFIGAIASSLVLVRIYQKRRPYFEKELDSEEANRTIPYKDMYQELLAYAGPFVLVGIATPLYQMVDQFTFNRAMSQIGLAEQSEQLLSVIILYGHKLVIIPVTLAIGLAMAVLPAITKSFTEQKPAEYKNYISQALLIIVLLVFPASIGLSIVAEEVYGALYNVDSSVNFAGELLTYYAPIALFLALFMVSSSMLQGINRQNFALVSLGFGLLIKIALNFPLIYVFEAKGAVFATGLAVLTASSINLLVIYKVTRFKIRSLYRRSLLIIILTAVMSVVVIFFKWLAGLPFGEEASKIKFIVQLAVAVPIGGYVYFWLAYKTTLLDRLFGDRVKRFAKLFP